MKLITELATIKETANAQSAENVRFRQFIKYTLPWSERRLDEFVLAIVREVEAAIDCTQCANCCRALLISLTPEDAERLAEQLGMSVAGFDELYVKPDAENERLFAHSPCAFLDGNRCAVYPARPRDCREYPHLAKGEFRSRMWQMLGHAEDCPIVFNVLQRMKAALWR